MIKRADTVIPGDAFDTHCGTGGYSIAVVDRVRYEDNDAPGHQDRVEIFYTTLLTGYKGSREHLASSKIDMVDPEWAARIRARYW